MNDPLLRILTDLLSLPTAPFAEHAVIRYVRDFCRARLSLRFSQDADGNVLIRHGRPARRPLVLNAHMDHPGFIALETARDGTILAAFHGGVRPECFENARVRFFCQTGPVRGRVQHTALAAAGTARQGLQRVAVVRLRSSRPVPPGTVGMWDFGDPILRGSRLHARGCDDVAGVAAILAALDVIAREHPEARLLALLTRAEEVGFAGAIAACRRRTLPADARVVAVECSSERPDVKLGDGPVCRVGDLSTIFTPALTAWCRTVAEQLQARDATFTFQRKLMDGGSCEASVYGEFGYEATGVSLPLAHYHNMNRQRTRLVPESIDVGDWHKMVKWFVALATTDVKYDGTHAAFRRRLKTLEDRYVPQLQETIRATIPSAAKGVTLRPHRPPARRAAAASSRSARARECPRRWPREAP